MKNKTKIDINGQYELVKLASKSIRVMMIILGLIIVFTGSLKIFLNKSFDGILSISIGVLIIIGFGFLWNKILYMISKQQLRSQRFVNDETYNIYEFNDDNIITIVVRDGAEISKSTLRYSDIYKVIDSIKFIFIFISLGQAFYLSKVDMIEGSIDDVFNKLQTHVNKFKRAK